MRRVVAGVGVWVMLGACGGKAAHSADIDPMDAGSDSSPPVASGGAGGAAPETGLAIERPIVHPCAPDALGTAGAPSNLCAGTAVETDWIPFAVTVLVDRSVTMNDRLPGASTSKWDAVRQAVPQFFATRPHVEDVALEFFSSPTTPTTCNASDYAVPVVPFDSTRTWEQRVQSLRDAFATTVPDAPLRPTAAALAGTMAYTQQWPSSTNFAFAGAMMVLITDGDDTACGATVDDLAELVKASPLELCVIQLGAGFDLSPMTAQAGIPGAFLIATGDAAGPLTDALFDCILDVSPAPSREMELPAPPNGDQTFDYAQTQVTLDGHILPMLPNAAACDASNVGGWYYDAPTQPSIVNLCACTAAALNGSLDLDVGLVCNP